jgi:NTE family protein
MAETADIKDELKREIEKAVEARAKVDTGKRTKQVGGVARKV